MENNLPDFQVEIKYCLKHGREVVVQIDGEEQFHVLNLFDPNEICYGEFAEYPPPPPLTPEQWEAIFVQGRELV